MKEGWEYKKLGEVCNTSSGGTPSKSHMEYYEGGTIPWLRSGEVAQGLIYSTELCITDLGMKNSSAKLFPIDTVVIAMYGATVGQVGILKKEMTTNQAICGVFPNKIFYPMFLFYCLKAKKSFFIKDAVGGAQPNISQNLIKKTEVPVPPLAEQHHIVEELDLLSSVIEKKKIQLNELDNMAQSLFNEMFGDPITNDKGWEVKKLGDLCVFLQGEQVPIEEQSEIQHKGMDRFLRIIDFTQGNEPPRYVFCRDRKHILNHDEIAVVRYGSPGYVCYGKYGVIANNLFKIVPKNKERFAFRFLVSWLLSDAFQSVVNGNQYGAALQAIKFGTIKDIPLIQPPLALQQQFAEKLQVIEHQKELIKLSIKEVETLFNSRMDYYFN